MRAETFREYALISMGRYMFPYHFIPDVFKWWSTHKEPFGRNTFSNHFRAVAIRNLVLQSFVKHFTLRGKLP